MKWTKSDVLALMVGHGRSLDGSWDSGCVYGDYTEAALMLKIVKVAVKYLKTSGVKVLTDADKDNNRNMKSCVAWANKNKNVKLYISCHCDYSLASSGIMFYYGSDAGKALGDSISKYVAKAMGMKFKGGVKDLAKFEVDSPKMTSVLYEAGAIKADLKKLKDYKKYGKALAQAICKYIGVKFKEHSTPYKVRVATSKVIKRMKELKFVYKSSYKDCSNTWAGAKKKKTSNCSMAISYSLQVAKVLSKGQFFWINGDKITCKGGLTLAKLKQLATITHPHKSPKKACLKKGDIVGYKNSPHTMEFAGWNSKGEPLWYSVGPSDIRKGKAHVKPSYNSKTIYTKIRFK